MYSDREGKHRFACYFDIEDWLIIKQRARKCKMNTTKYVRKTVLEGNVNIYDFKEANKIIYEINKIGNNINQLAKKANEINSIYKVDIEMMKKEYEDLCLMLSQFLSDLQ